MIKYDSFENLKKIKKDKFNKVITSSLSDYEKLVLILEILNLSEKVEHSLTEEDIVIINFLRNAIMHGHAYDNYDILDQMFRYEIIKDNMYLDFETIKFNENKIVSNKIINALKKSKLINNKEKSMYNNITSSGLTIHFNISEFLKKIEEAVNGNKK